MTVGRPKPVGRNSPNYTGALQHTIWLAEEIWPTLPHLHHLMNPLPLHTARQTTPGAWDGGLTLHKRVVKPPRPSSTMLMTPDIRPRCNCRYVPQAERGRFPEHDPLTAENYARVIVQMDNDDDRPQTTRWSGIGHCGCRHAPQAQRRRSPKYDPPTAKHYARVITQMDNDDAQPHQTARWSGVGPGHGHGYAP
jgi:hypothetical protein